MPDRAWEVGAGVAQVTPRPYVEETTASAGQIWVSGQVAQDRIALTAIAPFDDDAAGIGGALRFNAVDVDPLNAGIEAELGYLWLALSTPLSLRIVDQSHVYASPRLFNWSRDLSFGIPVGISVRIYDGFIVRAEWQRSWQDFKYYNRRDHYGAALAVQF